MENSSFGLAIDDKILNDIGRFLLWWIQGFSDTIGPDPENGGVPSAAPGSAVSFCLFRKASAVLDQNSSFYISVWGCFMKVADKNEKYGSQ